MKYRILFIPIIFCIIFSVSISQIAFGLEEKYEVLMEKAADLVNNEKYNELLNLTEEILSSEEEAKIMLDEIEKELKSVNEAVLQYYPDHSSDSKNQISKK